MNKNYKKIKIKNNNKKNHYERSAKILFMEKSVYTFEYVCKLLCVRFIQMKSNNKNKRKMSNETQSQNAIAFLLLCTTHIYVCMNVRTNYLLILDLHTHKFKIAMFIFFANHTVKSKH